MCLQLFGRTIKCSIAKDNGRASEFIRRKTYKNKDRCFECGESGHLSYRCPHNTLGDREQPKKLSKKDKKKLKEKSMREAQERLQEEEDRHLVDNEMDLAQAIALSHVEEEDHTERDLYQHNDPSVPGPSRGAVQKDSYFSDEDR
jgi:U11/U12 small nuclear ribonucleoprotein SNRNP31